jgi:hypothetical protein
MDENRLAGTAPDLGGKVQAGVGRSEATDATRSGAAKLDRWVRNVIGIRPCTSAMVALGIDRLLSQMHRLG